MEIDEQFLIAETDGWLVSHRMNSAMPGYLIIGSRKLTDDLSELSDAALRDIGPLLALAQTALKQQLNARRIYIGRYGHIPGLAIHFHVISIYHWVEELFWQDVRYRALQQFAAVPGETETDGAELTLFVWREFCERPDPPPIRGPKIPEVIEMLRKTMPLSSQSIRSPPIFR